MKSRKKTTIPPKTARTEIHIVSRREPAHPVIGCLPMSLARALTEPPIIEDQIVEEVQPARQAIRRRRAA